MQLYPPPYRDYLLAMHATCGGQIRHDDGREDYLWRSREINSNISNDEHEDQKWHH